jgi:SPP1 family predicted phage head-tail adaptor
MSFATLLTNRVVIEKRTPVPNASGEEIETFDDAGEIAASVQDRSPRQLGAPDVDGPVLVDAVIFTTYRTDIAHLDILRQVDVDPPKRYRVQFPRDPAGRHHHLEIDCEHVALVEAVGS